MPTLTGATCRTPSKLGERAIELGLPAIAFTDHADFVKVHDDQYCVDIVGYLESIDRCRAKYTGLRILSGVELGEPHWFPKETAEVLAAGPLDNVLGSVHCIKLEGQVVDASQFRDRQGVDFAAATRAYFAEVLAMIEGGQPFETLAHLELACIEGRARRSLSGDGARTLYQTV